MVYPNPAVDVFRVNVDFEDQAVFELIDLKGSVVQSGIIAVGSNPVIDLDRSRVNSGLHILRLSNAQGSNTTRVVVQ